MNGWTKKSKKKSKLYGGKQKWKHKDPNLWDASKAILRGEFTAIQGCIKKQTKQNKTKQKQKKPKTKQKTPNTTGQYPRWK